jgi:hypothetical protein
LSGVVREWNTSRTASRFWIEFLSHGYVAYVNADSTPEVRWLEGSALDKAVLHRQYKAFTNNARPASMLYRMASSLESWTAACV